MEKKWWKEAVVYQIYPRSFNDSNGDGIGDLQGIIQKLDYLKTLGVDVVWLSPIYKSPNDDNGYDISDYQDIMDEFGTLADFDEMVEGMHKRGIKLVMDLVVNHSSDEHHWFQEARKSKDNPYHDYYIWRPGKDGREPNNWGSAFGGSAWEYNPATDEYYLHLFSKKQPDLNWENPKVREEVFKMMHWWLERGVDGFRMDVINMISKVEGLPDELHTGPGGFAFPANTMNGPRLLEFLHEMKDQVLCRYDIITVGETPMVTPEHAVSMTHEVEGCLNMVFQFEHMDLDGGHMVVGAWNLADLKRLMTRWQKGMEGQGWNSNYLNNHDQPRQVSRFGDDKLYRVESAKLLGTFLHMLHGTPYVYQGEEIGMTNVAFESIKEYNDIETHNIYHVLVDLQGVSHEEAMQVIHAKSRDNARTPMHWSDAPQAGFTTGTPWLKVNPNYPQINVEQALADPNSIFYYYQKLIQLRHTVPAVVYGVYDLILADHEQIYAFTRTHEDERLVVMLNFSKEPALFELPAEMKYTSAELLIGNYPVDAAEDLRRLELKPYEARVYRLK